MTNDELTSAFRTSPKLLVSVGPAGGEFSVHAAGRDLVFTASKDLADRVAADLRKVPTVAVNAGLDLEQFASDVLRSHLTADTLARFSA